MKILVKAKPNSREIRVEKIDEGNYIVSVKEPPVQGRANAAIIEALAGYFCVSRASVRIISGYTSRQKTVEIAGL